jgi:hypothetical protein
MTKPVSPLDLFTLLEIAIEERSEAADAFDVFKQDAIMAPAPAIGDVPEMTSDDAAEVAAEEVDEFDAEVRALLGEATDGELAEAYQQSGGEVGHPVAEALLGEIKRRGLGV